MKSKVLPILTLVIISTTSLTAQIKKGDLLLGATVGFNNGSSRDYASSNSNISPRIAIGIGNNSAMGIRTIFGYQTSKAEIADDKTTTISIGGTLFWRKYMPIKKNIGWYLEPNGGASFSSNVRKYAPGKVKNTTTIYNVNVTPGIYYQPLPKLLINADFGGLGYSYSRGRTEGNPVNTYSNVYFNLLNHFTFGVDFLL